MPLNVPHKLIDAIVVKLPPGKRQAFEALLQAHGTSATDGWEFPEPEEWLKCTDMFYPNGRPPGPFLPPAKPRATLPSGEEVERQLAADGITPEKAAATVRRGGCCGPPKAD